MALSLKQVRYFIATADAGQISQAAIELNVSQSAVTAAIRQPPHSNFARIHRQRLPPAPPLSPPVS